MLSWKTLSLLVAAAVAMNSVTAIEQGYGGGVKLPSATTATPSDQSVVQETPSSVDASSALDVSSASNSYPSKSDTALPSGSGSNTFASPTSPGKTGVTFSSTGSAVEGSSAEQQGSYSSVASSSTSDSGSAPCDEPLSLAGSSATGSDVAGSSAIETSASGSEPCEGSLSLAGSASQPTDGSDATTPTSEAGSEATTHTSETGSEATTPTSEAGSDANTPTQSNSTGSNSTPTQTDASAATESSGSATFPSTGTSCKRRLRRN
eukprot:jgi/Phyca11/122328/e_gw1.47.126.1